MGRARMLNQISSIERRQAPYREYAEYKVNQSAQTLPDFRNFGVMLRILLGVTAALAAALVQSVGGQRLDCPLQGRHGAWVQPLLLFNMALL